jgi:hypothetical protein
MGLLMLRRIAFVLFLLLVAVFMGPCAWAWEQGFGNPDGSQDTWRPESDSWELEFRNPDGLKDTLDTLTDTWEIEFANPDGSVDRYRLNERGGLD